MGGVVVAHQPPAIAAASCTNSVSDVLRGVQLEPAVGRQPQQRPERGIDDPTVACHNDRTSGVLAHDTRERGADAEVELGDGLATRERHGVRVGLPIGHPVAIDEVAERQPVTVGPGVVLAEPGLDDDRQAEHRRDDLSGLDRPRIGAGVQRGRRDLAGLGQPIAQPLAPAGVRARTGRCTSAGRRSRDRR